MSGRLFAVAALLLAVACASGGEPDIATLASNSDQVIWEAGQKAYQKKQWDNARQHFRRIIDGFPTSEFGPPARLALGDTYFQEGGTGNSILAVGAYREFLTLYPSHPRSDYAQFQAAESFYKQRNGPERDQTPTLRALEEYQRLLDLYPDSPHAEKTRERIMELRQSLARSEYVAGYFYQRTRQAFRAAIARYEGILTEYPDYQRLDDVLLRLAECLDQSGRPAEAQPHLARLLAEYPDSEHAGEAQKLMAALATRAVTPPPSTDPTPAPTPQPPENSSYLPDRPER
ncbi:MAG TPA: outer membrane protein assembly factor BamD [Vicinamibacteria bacterium]|nr:outer membrane protein assembly factor BamD [Vicinamibacteria bacterium]